MLKRCALAAAVALLVGCAASAPQHVTLEATPADAAQLAGEWHGDYGSSSSGRHGTILFVLQGTADSAYGEVLMVPAEYSAPRTAAEASEQIRRPVPQILAIAFIHAEGGTFTGTLEPYRDPQCGCPLTTVFTGAFADPDVIRGTFTTTGPPGHLGGSGDWSVRRVKR
jgi:hypothetical protein